MNEPRCGWMGGIWLGITHVPVRHINQLLLTIPVYVREERVLTLYRRDDHILFPPPGLISRIHIKDGTQAMDGGYYIRPSITREVVGMLYPNRILGGGV